MQLQCFMVLFFCTNFSFLGDRKRIVCKFTSWFLCMQLLPLSNCTTTKQSTIFHLRGEEKISRMRGEEERTSVSEEHYPDSWWCSYILVVCSGLFFLVWDRGRQSVWGIEKWHCCTHWGPNLLYYHWEPVCVCVHACMWVCTCVWLTVWPNLDCHPKRSWVQFPPVTTGKKKKLSPLGTQPRPK